MNPRQRVMSPCWSRSSPPCIWNPRRESNSDPEDRSLVPFPLGHGGKHGDETCEDTQLGTSPAAVPCSPRRIRRGEPPESRTPLPGFADQVLPGRSGSSERAARIELASSGWRPDAFAIRPRPLRWTRPDSNRHSWLAGPVSSRWTTSPEPPPRIELGSTAFVARCPEPPRRGRAAGRNRTCSVALGGRLSRHDTTATEREEREARREEVSHDPCDGAPRGSRTRHCEGRSLASGRRLARVPVPGFEPGSPA